MTEDLIADGKRKGVRSRRGEKLLAYIDKYADVLNEAECRMVNYDIWMPNIIVSQENGEKKYWWIDPNAVSSATAWRLRVSEFFKPFREKTLSFARTTASRTPPYRRRAERRSVGRS